MTTSSSHGSSRRWTKSKEEATLTDHHVAEVQLAAELANKMQPSIMTCSPLRRAEIVDQTSAAATPTRSAADRFKLLREGGGR